MLEDFVDSLRNFARNKTRTILSLLGVIIGVASVILITSMGQSSTRQIEDTFGSSGLDLVQVSSGFMRRRREAVSLKFDETFRQELFDNVRNIRRIWYKNSLSATLSFGDTSVTASCTAIEPGYLEMYGLDLDYGDYFT
ncbi:MAG: ABC transporter permease, partial [Treponemataceae bacterium]|nr:ABC transporter permease [Treponemataceae bacterium]